ncbi:MAG TPA: hypothetical protein VLG46_17515 [Anaerolineae bacterium]|nr:hypothetical protein [Anaerolineae bacterium]
MKFNQRITVAIVSLIGAVLIGACGTPGRSNEIPATPAVVPVATAAPIVPPDQSKAETLTAAGDASTPLQLTLSLEQPRRVGAEVEATLTIKTARAVPQVTATLSLPAGVIVVSGETTWRGDLAAEQSVTLHSRLRFTTGGNLELSGHTRHEFENGDVWADLATIYLNLPEPDQTPAAGTPTPPPAVPAS